MSATVNRMKRLKRRSFLVGMAGVLIAPYGARGAADSINAIIPAVQTMSGSADIQRGKVALSIPRLVDNGNLVPCRISIDSPMTQAEYVRRVGLFSESNPRPVIAIVHLGPRAGKAEIDTRIRLAGTQRVVAVAELSDGSFWYGMAESVVTVSACLDGT